MRASKCILIAFLAASLGLSTPKCFAIDKEDLSFERDRLGKVLVVKNKSVNKRSKSISSQDKQTESKLFIRAVADSFGVQDPDKELRESAATVDQIDNSHIQYEQLHKDIPVYGAALVSHIGSSGEVLSVNGRTLPNLKLGTKPNIAAKRAVKVAMQTVQKRIARSLSIVLSGKAKAECKGKTGACYQRKMSKSNSGGLFKLVGKAKLKILDKDFIGVLKGAKPELVWEVVLADPKDDEYTYFINAQTSKVTYAISPESHLTRQIYDCALVDASSVGCRLDILKLLNGGEYYYLGRSEGQPPRGPMPAGAGAPYAGSTDVDDAYNIHLPLIHQFMLERFGRDGANNRGGTGNGSSVPFTVSRFFVHGNGEPTTGVNVCNPYFAWAGTTSIIVCANMLNNPALNINDLLLHEYGHLVNRYRTFNANGSANSLLGTGLAGSLNENMSDIFGISFEKYRTGTYDWEMFQGSGLPSASGPEHVRSLSNPSLTATVNGLGSPDRYYSPNFYCGTGNSGGIHYNSTVPGKAAYLASEGGSFNGCTINPIGVDKVVNIWYRALINYHAPSETFNGAYHNFIQACNDLYPASDCAELTKALQAVEMDQPGACSGIPRQTPACAVANQTLSLNLSTTENCQLSSAPVLNITNDASISGSAVIANLSSPTASCEIVVKAQSGTSAPQTLSTCAGASSCNFNLSTNFPAYQNKRITLTATATNCSAQALSSSVTVSNYGAETLPSSNQAVPEGAPSNPNDPQYQVLTTRAFPSELTVSSITYNSSPYSPSSPIPPPQVRNVDGPMISISASAPQPGGEVLGTVSNSRWIGLQSGADIVSNMSFEDANPYYVVPEIAFGQCGLTYTDPSPGYAVGVSLPPADTSVSWNTTDLNAWAHSAISSSDSLESTQCCYQPNAAAAVNFMTASTNPIPDAIVQHRSMLLAEQERHREQVLKGLSATLPGAPLPWSQGGLGDSLSMESIIALVPVTMDGQRGKMCATKPAGQAASSVPACQSAYNSAQRMLNTAVQKQVSAIRTQLQPGSAKKCWMDYAAKSRAGLTPQVAGYHYEVACSGCSAFDYRGGMAAPAKPGF